MNNTDSTRQDPIESNAAVTSIPAQVNGTSDKASNEPELIRWTRLFVTAALVILTMVAVQLASHS